MAASWLYCGDVERIIEGATRTWVRCEGEVTQVPVSVAFSELEPTLVAQHFGAGFLLIASIWWGGFAVRSLIAILRR